MRGGCGEFHVDRKFFRMRNKWPGSVFRPLVWDAMLKPTARLTGLDSYAEFRSVGYLPSCVGSGQSSIEERTRIAKYG